MDDRTSIAYAAWPERLYVVDIEGQIAYAGKPGPRGFYPLRNYETYAWPGAPPFDPGISLEEFLESAGS